MKNKNISASFVEEEISINDDVLNMLDDYRHKLDDYYYDLESQLEDGILFHLLEIQKHFAIAAWSPFWICP